MKTIFASISFTGILLAGSLANLGFARAPANSRPPHAKLTSIQILETAGDFFNQGDYENARNYYLEALRVYPRNFDVLKNLGFCYYTMGPRGRTQAVHFYSLAHEIDPASREVGEQLAKCLSSLNRYGESAVILRQLAERPDGGPEAWKNVAEAYDSAHRVPEAVAAYQVYLKIKPDDLEARSKLGSLYGRQTAYTKALDEFRMVLSKNPGFPPALIGEARILSWQGQFEESARLYDRVLQSEPANGEAASGKAFALLWAGHAKEAELLFATLHQRFPRDLELERGLEHAQAILAEKTKVKMVKEIADEAPHDETYFRERLTRNPLDAAALKALTAFASTPQRCSESIEYGRQALKLAPDDLGLELSLANSLTFCQQYGEAVQHYRRYLKAQPKAEGVFYELAQALLRSQQTAESISVLQNLLQLDPANEDARLILAQAHATLGQYSEAMARYEEVLRASPENYDALQGKAFVLYWTKQFAPARAIFQNLEAQRPGDLQNADALMGIGRAEEESRWQALRPLPDSSPEDFARYYGKRLESFPDDGDALKGMADSQAQMKNLPEAIRDYQRLAEKYPQDQEARKELARLLSLNGQYDESIKLYLNLVKDNLADDDALRKLATAYIWEHRTKEAIAIYKDLSAKFPSNLDYKFEVAHLELALKDYPAAREVLASLLFVDPRNHAARIELAQIELSEGAWDASLKHFGQLLREDSEDPDALMGQARIAYYKGNWQQAQLSAETLAKEQPDNFDAIFLLASIEHARGNHRATLALLNHASLLAPTDPGVAEMKKRVSEDSAVTVTTSAVYAREIGPPALCLSSGGCGQVDLHEDLRTYSYGTTIKAHFLPRTDSFISYTALPSDSPLGRDAEGIPIPTGISGAVAPEQFLYRQSTQIFSRLTLRAGAGWVSFGPGKSVDIPGEPEKIMSAVSSPLAQGGLSYAISKKISLDLDVNHSAIPYTPVAARLGVMETRSQGGVNVFFTPRTEMNVDYFYATYSSERYQHTTLIGSQKVISVRTDNDQGHGASATVNRNIYRSSRFSFDAGYAGRFYGFAGNAQQSFMGFFNPGFYQSQLLTTRLRGNLWGPLGYDFSGGVGVQQIEHSGALTRALNVSPAIIIRMNRKLSLTLGYTHYNTAQSLGNLRGNAVRLSTTFAF